MIRALPVALWLLCGCAYRVGEWIAVRDVRLNILDAQPERRTHEFDLTEAIARELMAQGVRVNSPAASHELTGVLLGFEEPARVVDLRDVPIVGAVRVRLRIRLVDRNSGTTVAEDEREETADFTRARSESPETARQEVFDRLARWVATKFETDW